MVHVHFETRADNPAVFLMTEPVILAAKARAAVDVSFSLNDDPRDLSWLERAAGLVTSNDLLLEPDFPLRDLTRRAPNLRWIHIIGAGIEPLLPLDWMPDGMVLTNNSGVHVEKTRESAMMALLMLHGRLPAMITQQRQHLWRPIFTSRISGRRLLVVGVGDMGGGIAAAGRSLGLRVTGVRRSGAPHPDVERMVTLDALETVLPEADFVALAAPLTPETRGMLNRRRLALMKPGAAIYNVGRGGLIDHVALAECLRSGAISGAVLDVFDPEEPLPASSPLWDTPNLVIMPHVTSDDLDTYLPDTFDMVFANVMRLARGEKLLNRVDPGRGY
jgi:phosphoglycerate dehydrogenase-like enzyme